MYREGKSVYLNENACPEEKECFITEEFKSTCERVIERDEETLLYPGYFCNMVDPTRVCAYGGKFCKMENQICYGQSEGHECHKDSDCFWGLYCGDDSVCEPLRLKGETCTSNSACERGNMCYFLNAFDAYGKCIEVLSLDRDQPVLPFYNKQYANQFDNEKMCRDGKYNITSGRCSKLVKSKNKGKACKTKLDCPTTDPDAYAECKCGYGEKGQKYCDIEGGDEEWVNYVSKF